MHGVEEFWAYWRNNFCIQEMIRLSAGGGGGGSLEYIWVTYVKLNFIWI